MPEPTYITGWRDVASALRRRDLRAAVVLALAMTATAYLLCFAVALLVAQLGYLLAVRPMLNATFGHVPAAGAVQLAVGAAVGTPAYWGCVRLMYRWINRLNRRPGKGVAS
jgi:hypothetical protein